MEIIKHFTATTYIVHENKILLHFHKKLKMWMAVGGHVEDNELPEKTALREAKEETGLDVELIWQKHTKHLSKHNQTLGFPRVASLNKPMHLMLEEVSPTHYHIDFIYYAKAYTFKLNPEDGESTSFKWVSWQDLQSIKLAEDVKSFSQEAILFIKNSKLTY